MNLLHPVLPGKTIKLSFSTSPEAPSLRFDLALVQRGRAFSIYQFSSGQSLSCVRLCDPMNHSTPGLCPSPTPRVNPNSCPLSQWCHPTISSFVSPSPPTFNLSQHHGLSNESVLCIRWPKYWISSIGQSISINGKYSGSSLMTQMGGVGVDVREEGPRGKGYMYTDWFTSGDSRD